MKVVIFLMDLMEGLIFLEFVRLIETSAIKLLIESRFNEA